MKILMVCLGNICRSPLAEGIMREKIKSHKLEWQVDSAGTGSWHVGASPDPRSIDVARLNNIDITHQRGRQFLKDDFSQFDLIFAMDSQNYQNITKLAPDNIAKEKVQLIMNLHQPGYNQSVPDPYWNDDGFQGVFDMLDLACEGILKKYAGE